MKLFPSLSDDLAQWAEKQPVFFTGSAPTHGRHVNVSPKGLSAHFAVLSPNLCAYIDRTGSGCETIAHSYENGRLTLMFMSFGPAPRIMRLFGRSSIVEYDDPAFPGLMKRISRGKECSFDGARAVILLHINEVQTSCGFGVPMIRSDLYNGKSPEDGTVADSPSVGHDVEKGTTTNLQNELAVFCNRPTLDKWARHKADANEIREYQTANNAKSMDGLPGLRLARRDAGEWIRLGDIRTRAYSIFMHEKAALFTGAILAIIVYFVLYWAKGLYSSFA